MESPRKIAERIVGIITNAIEKDPVVQDLYSDFSFDIIEEEDGCFVPVTDYFMAWCKHIGEVVLVAAQGSIPVVGEIPVLTPLTKESFTLALMYAINVQKLNKQQMSQLMLRKLSNEWDDEHGGIIC
jgi:hypothetical protein